VADSINPIIHGGIKRSRRQMPFQQIVEHFYRLAPAQRQVSSSRRATPHNPETHHPRLINSVYVAWGQGVTEEISAVGRRL
ncbi:hypothetical protein, partial [Frankia sp. Cj5]|uniref:hypothetical protein n=1 Tax=Frankia sp. Cj5 TaxID=2880978 RepID=UPI001EF53653